METKLNLLISRLTLVKEDMIMLLNECDFIVTDTDNINATLNNVNRALKIAKELETETKLNN